LLGSVDIGKDLTLSSPKSKRTRLSTNGERRSTSKLNSNILWCEFDRRLHTKHSRIGCQLTSWLFSRFHNHMKNLPHQEVFRRLLTILMRS
jgi:hypothetical protein